MRSTSLPFLCGPMAALLLPLLLPAAAPAAAATRPEEYAHPGPVEITEDLNPTGDPPSSLVDSSVSLPRIKALQQKLKAPMKTGKADPASLPNSEALPFIEGEGAPHREGPASTPLEGEEAPMEAPSMGGAPHGELLLGDAPIPIVSPNNDVVGSFILPPLNRSRRHLRGVKMLLISLLLFMHLAGHRNAAEGPSFEEKLTLTLACVGLARLLQSLLAPKPEYEFSLRLLPDAEGEGSSSLKAELNYKGLPESQEKLTAKLLKLGPTLLMIVPSFFLVSGLIASLGFGPTVALVLGTVLVLGGGLVALTAGAGGPIINLINQL